VSCSDYGAGQAVIRAATTRVYLNKLAPRSAKAGRAVQKAIEETT